MIYFIQDEGTLNIKVGYTGGDDALQRLRELQTGCPTRLVLLGTCPGVLQDEKRLHLQFASAHVQGEWFRPAPDLLRFIISRAGLAFATRAFASASEFLLESETVQVEPEPREFVAALLRREKRAVLAFVPISGTPRLLFHEKIVLTPDEQKYVKRHEQSIIEILIDVDLIERERPPVPSPYRLRSLVRHPTYGVGRIVECANKTGKVKILFAEGGERTFIADKASLVILPEGEKSV